MMPGSRNRKTTLAALIAALATSTQLVDLPPPWRAATIIVSVLAIAALGIFAADAPTGAPATSPPDETK